MEDNDLLPLLLVSLQVFEHIQSHYTDYDDLMMRNVMELLETLCSVSFFLLAWITKMTFF